MMRMTMMTGTAMHAAHTPLAQSWAKRGINKQTTIVYTITEEK